MAPSDFISSLGRLLHDGALRDALKSAPRKTIQRLGVQQSVGEALLDLNSEDLEFQARVLLRKRFQGLTSWLPATTAALGDQAWPLFLAFGRTTFPCGQPAELHDAGGFLQHLFQITPRVVARSEANRIGFALGRQRFAFHFSSDLLIRNRARSGLQIFLRFNSGQYREWRLYPAF